MKVCGLAIAFRDKLVEETGLPFEFFAVDTIGVGAGVYDRMAELEEPAADVNVGRAAMKKGKRKRIAGLGAAPAKLKDELYLEVRKWIRDEGMIPAGNGEDEGGVAYRNGIVDVLISELTAPHYDIVSDGKLKVESKESMRKRGQASPNLLDGMAMTFFPHRTTGRKSFVDTI